MALSFLLAAGMLSRKAKESAACRPFGYLHVRAANSCALHLKKRGIVSEQLLCVDARAVCTLRVGSQELLLGCILPRDAWRSVHQSQVPGAGS